jgi:hypothetical protein
MRRLVILGIICMVAVACYAQDTPRPQIPEGVKYTFMDDKQNAEVRDFLAAQFHQGQSGVAELFVSECMCAPGYWRLVAGFGIKAPKIKAFSVPNERTGKVYIMNGAQIQDSEDLNQISQDLAMQVGTEPTIRRLTTKEIAKFWVIVPFNIEEPLFVVESGNKQFVVCLKKRDSGNKWRIWWIDALNEYDWGQGSPQGAIEQSPKQASQTLSSWPFCGLFFSRRECFCFCG